MEKRDGSYKVGNISQNADIEINRLKGQVELFWSKEVLKYKECGLKDGMTVLEVGSGPGFVLEKLMEEFQNSQMFGIEIDSSLVKYSKEYLTNQGYKNFSIYEGSAMDLESIEQVKEKCDFVIMRLVLEHLLDPLSAIKQVFHILKPGGKAIFIDNDFEMHLLTYPPVKKLRELYDAYCEARIAEGGNPRIGRELPNLINQAGFKNIDFQVICAHSLLCGKSSFQKSEGIGIPTKLVEDGYLTSKKLGEILVEWSKVFKDENSTIIRQLFFAMGEKVDGK
jgi:ubiquinone/menaquinone biosynthesis C-methylase UbiE